MSKVIFIVCAAIAVPTPDDCRYLKSYDPDALGGCGLVETTDKVAEAMKFATAGDAFVCYQQVSKTRPTRPDGKPNRPLTAFNIEVLDEEEMPLWTRSPYSPST